MTSPVTIELPPMSAASPYTGVLLEACTVGMHAQAPCVLGPRTALSDQGAAVAIVVWDGPRHAQARVELGMRVEGVPRWLARVLSFGPDDPEVERWRTLGFAIATLVGDAFQAREQSSQAREQSPQAREQSSQARERSSQARERSNEDASALPAALPGSDAVPGHGSTDRARAWLDGRFVISRGVNTFSPAAGGELRLSRVLGFDRWFASGGLRCTVQTSDVDWICSCDRARRRVSAPSSWVCTIT